MAYTNNVPQASQQIAATQAPIQANFAFLDTGIGTEHNFNASGSGSDMYHLQASMPNQSDPSSLPAGTNGLFYVNGGLPKFYNSAGGAQFITLGEGGDFEAEAGSASIANGSTANMVPAGNNYGIVIVNTYTSSPTYQVPKIFSYSNNNGVLAFLPVIGTVPVTLQVSGNPGVLQVQNLTGATNTFNWLVIFTPVP